MSKKIIKHKNASFTLEPDGFSIHTFELSRKLTKMEYDRLKDSLYKQQEQSTQKGWMYKSKNWKGVHICTLYAQYGIRITLEHNESESFDTYFVRMVINPRKLIEPDCSYLGILPPEESSVKQLKKSFEELFQESDFEADINSYQISRVDLCTNIRCDNKKLFRELVRVLRKLPTPPKYERKAYKHKDKKKANRYNKHYLRFGCGTHELVIYDKTYQMQEKDLVISYEKLPEGVLRFEVHCGRQYLRNIEKKSGEPDTDELLWQLIQESEKRIVKHFSQCFPDVTFMQTEAIQKKIAKCSLQGESKKLMLKLVERLQRTQSVDRALEKMEKEGFDTSGLLDRFTKLGVSPIPLWKNFCAKELPGPVELLKHITDGKISVEYVKVKYK